MQMRNFFLISPLTCGTASMQLAGTKFASELQIRSNNGSAGRLQAPRQPWSYSVIQIKSTLLGAEAPRVLTVPMIASVLADRRSVPARNTIFKWIRAQVGNGALRPVTRGLYINQLASPRPAAAEAAAFVRSGAIVSLQ